MIRAIKQSDKYSRLTGGITMNRVLKSAVVAIFSACMFSWQLHADVINITQGSTSGYTMTDGNTYVVQDSVTFSNSTAGGSGMTVEDGATVVLYVPVGVTLTATGANGSGQIGGGAGIRVPESATLVITGEGTINASGGNAGNGGNGANGNMGTKPVGRYINDGSKYTAKGQSGTGGAGGVGGGGAGAAIGGIGGEGGSSGSGAASLIRSDYTESFGGNGKNGSSGGNGSAGGTMGKVFVIGSVSISLQGGQSGTSGKAGSFAEMISTEVEGYGKYYFSSCGGGGGGGGGAGNTPSNLLGGGGASGGGGGGGGSGALLKSDANMQHYHPQVNAHGGGGSGGSSQLSNGVSGVAKASSQDGYYNGNKFTRTGGSGGSGGAAGAEGGVGTLYVSPTATVNVDRTKLSATTHLAAQYTITFDANGGQFSSVVESLTATLGCELPDCIPTPTRVGYIFDGWRTATADEYYGAAGTKSKSSYSEADDVILYAQWHLDADRAVLPDSAFWLRENAETGWRIDPDAGEGEVLRSGEIGNSTNSWMETTIVGPASFSFDWKVSCNTRGHYLAWFVDGVEQARIRGVTDWATVTASIPEGEHVVRFDYVKGSTAAAGEDKGQVSNFVIDPVRIETETMQVMWDWATNYLVSVSATGFGTSDFESGWIADGSNVVVTIAPTIHSYSISLSGDTEGAVLDGTNLTFQVCGAARSIAVSVDEVKPCLVVASAHGTPTPAVGDHLYSSDAEVTVSVDAPSAVDGVRSICTGWTGTGSVPASGDGSSAAFVITEDSSITWNWATGYWVEFSIVGKGTTSYEAQWVSDGTNLVIPFSVNTPFYSLSLSGDAEGAVLGADSITVPITAPRSIVLNVTEYTYGTALDSGSLPWVVGGAANWVPQGNVSHDGQDAVRSGEVTGDDVSTLSTSVTGAGTLSWWWKLNMADCAGVDVFVDESLVESLDSASDWVSASVDIVGDGEHAVRFEFWNAGTAATISDCAYLDQMSWTGESGGADHTVTTPEPVPFSFLEKDCPTLLAEHGGDYEATALATALNGCNKVWECFVAGISPTNATSRFTAKIEMRGSEPIVTWEPDLNTNGIVRIYKVYGSETLDGGGDWQYPTNSFHRFFKVMVEMP